MEDRRAARRAACDANSPRPSAASSRPLFEQQQAFNAAVVDHVNRNVPRWRRDARVDREHADGAARHASSELVRFQSLLVEFLQQITPYVDTRDRDVAGLLRGLSGAINAVADELLKRTEAMLARDRRHELQVAAVAEESKALRISTCRPRSVGERAARPTRAARCVLTRDGSRGPSPACRRHSF